MSRIDAQSRNARALRFVRSQSLARRRQRLSQAMVRSTIHRFGRTMNLPVSLRLTMAVDDGGRRAGLAPGLLAALDIERVVDAPQRAIPIPAAEVVVHRAARRQVLRQRRPLAAGAENVHHPVDHFTHHHRALVAAAFGGRDQRRDQRPFRVRQVARVPQLASVIATALLEGPHPAAPANRTAAIESQAIPTIQAVSGWTLSLALHVL